MAYIKCVTPEQQNALEELKNRVKNELTSPTLLEDDALFYKFLKSRGFNVDKAEKLLRKHIVWRKVHRIDTILETFKPKEVFVKYVEPSVIGLDRDGDIVTYIASGRINNTDLSQCMKLNDYIKHFIWFAEKHTSLNKQQRKKEGVKAPVSLIVDLDKLELSNATSKVTRDMFLRLTRLIRDNYAERLKAAYIINAPSYYVYVFAVIKAVMSNVMIQRIHIFGHSGWKEKLLESINADVLPAFLGGKRTDPGGDPYCKSFITLPEKIPDSYFLSDEERYFTDPTEVCRSLITPSAKKVISLYVKEAESLIRWKFIVINRTIEFGLFFQEDHEKVLEEIFPMYEYDTSDGTEENFYKCSSKGKYIVVFDNTSRFRTKEIQYTVSVEKPEK